MAQRGDQVCFILDLDLAFCRVHIDIELIGRHLDKDAKKRMNPGGEQRPVYIVQMKAYRAVFDRPVIDKDELHVFARALYIDIAQHEPDGYFFIAEIPGVFDQVVFIYMQRSSYPVR